LAKQKKSKDNADDSRPIFTKTKKETMDTLFFDTHNILLNGQPYPFNSIRPRYPQVAGDNVAALYFPWWTTNAFWSGDVTQLINGATSAPFTGMANFKAFVNAHFYTDTFSGGLVYLGTWDASTNTPTLANGTGTAGDFYICSVGGSVDFGAGSITFIPGDIVIYNGSVWDKAVYTSMGDLQQVTDIGATSTHDLKVHGFKDQSAAQAITFNTNGFTVSKSGNTIYDSAANESYDNSGNVSVKYNTRTLNDGANIKYNWSANQFKDNTGTLAADLDNRLLYASDGSLALNHSNPGVLKAYTKLQLINSSGDFNVELSTEGNPRPSINIYNFTENTGFALECTTDPYIILYRNSGTDYLQLKCDDLLGSGHHAVNFQAANGTVAFLSDIPPVFAGNFTATGTSTQTVYNIPHGLPATPAGAAIVARNAATAGLLAGSYYITTDATNIIVTLLVATVGTPAIDLNWVAW